VKPTCLAGSAGVYATSMVRTRAEVRRLAKRIQSRFDVPAVCDEFIVGREFRVGLVENARGTASVSGIAEWRFADAKPGWGFKTEAIRGNARVRRAQNVKRGTFALKAKTLRSLSAIAQESMRVLGVRGYATIDFRLDAEERPIVLEVNSNPGLSSRGAVWSLPSFDTNIRLVVEAALRGRETPLG
jgi:D-alanine-D-alanine ligase